MEIEKAIEVLKGLIANFKMQREDRLSNLVFGRLSRVIEALELAIQALEKQNGWIPVSERLPDESGYYLIQQDCCGVMEYMRVARYNSQMQKFRNAEAYRYYKKVIAWQPLPEPYNEV